MRPARPVAPAERGALMAALAAVPGLAADDATLLALATSIAALPDKAAPRQLLVDVGANASGQAMPAALRTLLQAPPAGVQVAPVFLSDRGGVWHYRYADGGANPVADLRAGDILYCADSPQALEDGLFDHLRRIGIDIHVADDPVALALRSLQPAPSLA
jgi:hypothetical protein